MRLPVLILFVLSVQITFGQNKEAYAIFNAKGKESSYKKLIKDASEADIIFFGELHNNAIAHWLQLELTREIGNSRPLVLGAEMFEADNQEALNDFLAGNLDQKGLDSTARLWPNYKTDYAPLVLYAKSMNYPFIATNIPRRYASLVYKKGFGALDTLSAAEKAWIAPLPIYYDPELPAYKNMLTMMGDHASPTMPMAQASKDATMAHFIAENMETGKGFIHYNGSYHSDDWEGIVWYLKRLKPGIRILTITTVEQNDIQSLLEENTGKADYTLCVDEDVTHTY